MADLDTIMSERPAEEPVEQTQPRDDGRDEHGRFASQQPAPDAPQQPVAQQEPTPPANPLDGYVPIQTLDARLAKQEEKLRRDFAVEMQQRLSQFQPPKPAEPVKAPDIWENPDAAVDYRLQQAIAPLQQGQQGIVENFSRMMASDKFGEDTVQAALAEMTNRVTANPAAMRFDYQRIMSAPHPYGELVKWHKAQSALSEIGDDTKAYREKLRAEILAEMQQGGQQQPPTSQASPVLPTSFAGSRSAGPNSAPAYSGPRPLSEIMNGR